MPSSAWSAAATGVALNNTVMIVAGMIVGASGTILTNSMAKAMNRSVPAIVAGGFGGEVAAPAGGTGDGDRTVRSTSAADVAIQLAYARLVVVAPGYGMAVAQAQHAVRELEKALEAKGVEVKFAIHPVAGRMPGHMNVLLAEADVPYDRLKEMDEINPEFSRTDVVLVIGANDVTNPAAKNEPGSPIYGMPILEVDHASGRDRAQALDGLRIRRDRQPSVLRAQDEHALRRRQAVGQRDHLRGDGALPVSSRGDQPASGGTMDPNRLTAIPIFSHLSDEEAKRLAAFATETSVAEGQILMKQGDYSTELIAIQEGTADVLRDGDKIASLKQGDLIGEMGLLERRPRNADVIATSPMRLLKLTHWEIRRMSQATVDRIKQIVVERQSAGVADPADATEG